MLDAEGRVLLVRHSYGKERWSLPGGEVDPGESPAEAAVREAREEAGIEVELDHLIGVYFLRSKKNGLRFMFAARITAGEPTAADADEIAEVGWFEPEAAAASRRLRPCPTASGTRSRASAGSTGTSTRGRS